MATANQFNSPLKTKETSRRNVLAFMAAGLAATAVPLQAYAFAGNSGHFSSLAVKRRRGEPTLAKYLCSQVHGKIAANLDDIIADPAIDGERTALALMEARCPGCGERVTPATSHISAVVPQWKAHNASTVQSGVSA